MNITNLFKVSIKAVANNKMRSFLSMLGIIIGVAAVIIMMAIGQGSKESIRKELSTMGTNLLAKARMPFCSPSTAMVAPLLTWLTSIMPPAAIPPSHIPLCPT